MRTIYIAGPYSGRDYHEIDAHIGQAREAAAALADAGVGFFCPHLHSAHFEAITPGVPYTFWLDLDMHFLASCDAMLMLPGWQESKGAVAESEAAVERGLPIWYSVGTAISWARRGAQ